MINPLAFICIASFVSLSACQTVGPMPIAGVNTPAEIARRPVPDSEVFLADLDLASETVSRVRNISQHLGYDNQPAFIPNEDALWVVSDRMGAQDVFRYDIVSNAISQVTTTKEAEFSPTPLPDRRGFSATRVASPDGIGEVYTESQQLWRYSVDGKSLGSVVPIKRVGYHAWLDANHVALFLVGSESQKQPSTLVLADVTTGSATLLATSVGRSLARTPDGKHISFIDKRDPANWSIAAMAPGDQRPTLLVATPKGPPGEKDSERSEDYCWLPDGGLLMAKNSQLLRWDGKVGSSFRGFAELNDLGGTIKRLAVSRDGKRLAFVVQMR